MPNDHYVTQAWIGLLDAERLVRYYDVVAARLQRWNMGLTALVAVGSAGVAGALLLDAPGWIARSLSIAVVVASLCLCYGHASKAAAAEAARDSCADLSRCWRSLWACIANLDDVEAARQVDALHHRERMATARVPAHLTTDRRLNERCAREAYGVLSAEFAVA